MRNVFGVLVLGLVVACSSDPDAAQTLDDVHAGHDWQWEPAGTLDDSYVTDVRRIFRSLDRAGAIAALNGAGYDCQYGEAHEDYPEPAAVCARSFATRACQLDWEVVLTTDPKRPGGIDSLDADFRRDCVGTDRDWPEPVRSAIDDQLAEPGLPE